MKKIAFKNQNLSCVDYFSNILLQYQETKNIIVCSLLCIVTHMGPHLSPDKQVIGFLTLSQIINFRLFQAQKI